MSRRLFLIGFWLLLSSIAIGQHKRAPRQPPFVIHPDKPFVYIEFSGFKPRVNPEGEVGPDVWLKLVNNCRVPVTMLVNGGETDDEALPRYEVVYDERELESTITIDGKSSQPPRLPRWEMPVGNPSHVGTALTLRPGGSVPFRIPTSHISRDWHIEVPFEFELPPARCCQPVMAAWFGMHNIPEEMQGAFRK